MLLLAPGFEPMTSCLSITFLTGICISVEIVCLLEMNNQYLNRFGICCIYTARKYFCFLKWSNFTKDISLIDNFAPIDSQHSRGLNTLTKATHNVIGIIPQSPYIRQSRCLTASLTALLYRTAYSITLLEIYQVVRLNRFLSSFIRGIPVIYNPLLDAFNECLRRRILICR